MQNRRTITSHSKTFLFTTWRRRFLFNHSLGCLCKIANHQTYSLFFCFSIWSKENSFNNLNSFINFRMAISSRRFRFLDSSLPAADSPYREDCKANNHLIVGWIKQIFEPKLRSSISACKIASYGTFIKLLQRLAHELLLPPILKIVQSHTCYHVWTWGRVLGDLEDRSNPVFNIKIYINILE